MQKREPNKYFNFTRKERRGTIFLLFIITVISFIPVIYSMVFKDKIIQAVDIQKELASLKLKAADSSRKYPEKYTSSNDQRSFYQSPGKNYQQVDHGVVFNFDPNSLPAAGWKKLGLKDKTIQTIQNFISKGGKFFQPEDLKKIWGLHEDEIQRLLPYVKIERTVSPLQPIQFVPASNKYENKKNLDPVEINSADSNVLTRLPGIGSRLSKRIIDFREKLGGFYSIEQVGETFGLPDSVFQKIKPALKLSGQEIKQININTASVDELKSHPYIRYNLANIIVQYRSQHGNFVNIADLKRIMMINEEIFSRISPYLTVK